MDTDAAKFRRQALLAPPRTLDVRKYAECRAAEIESLHTIVSNRLGNDFRSSRNKRRRTTGFESKNRRFRKHSTFKDKEESKNQNDNEQKKLPRRVRRKIELTKKNLEFGFSVSGDGTKRLRTHVWHAKRFTMEKLWGFYLPSGLHGRYSIKFFCFSSYITIIFLLFFVVLLFYNVDKKMNLKLNSSYFLISFARVKLLHKDFDQFLDALYAYLCGGMIVSFVLFLLVAKILSCAI